MKLQGLGIIFIIITFPMILVLSYYLGLQIDTVKLQTSYDNKLIDATYDAMLAFEINTANEDLSQVADSLRSIVDASTATFTNTLGTSLGLSNANRDRILANIPSILYTLYDGYYIYAPTEMPVVLEEVVDEKDGIVKYKPKENEYGEIVFERENGIGTTDVKEAKRENEYTLKPFMPYSATYSNGIDTVTINYTLDNYMTVSGKINGVYYTKSGYYINDSLLKDLGITINLSGGAGSTTIEYNDIFDSNSNLNQEVIKKNCLESSLITIKLDGIDEKIIATTEDEIKAATYYITNTIFSKWVNDNLKDLVIGDNLQQQYNTDILTEQEKEIYHNFDEDVTQIFGSGNNPEDINSNFNEHKYNVIKNSILYNLNLAISAYSNEYMGADAADFKVPELTENEWENITSKVSIVSFLQGLECGLKQYNGYSVISSSNNELTVIPEEIYYVKKDGFNDINSTEYYHRIDCSELDTSIGTKSFKSKEVKYDKIYQGDITGKYLYDHQNLACYNCIVQSNYNNIDTDSDGNKDRYIGLEEFIKNASNNVKKAYYLAIGKERQNLYKSIEYSKNEGIKVVNDIDELEWEIGCYAAEITVEVKNPQGIVKEIYIGGNPLIEKKFISTSTRSKQTIYIEKSDIGATVDTDISVEGAIDIINVLSIKYIYK